MKDLTIQTTFYVAVNWLRNSYILCNDIVNIDPDLFDETINVSEENEEGETNDVFQYFLSNCSYNEAKFLADHFDLSFAYSELLGLWVLLVYHYGTAWDYVSCYTDLPAAKSEFPK